MARSFVADASSPAQHFRRIGHLRNGFGGYEAAEVERIETHVQQGVQVAYLFIRRYLARPSLHGVARAFNEFEHELKY